RDQSTDHQIDALAAAGVAAENMFIEKVSGKLSSRPKLDLMLDKLRAGDAYARVVAPLPDLAEFSPVPRQA
ncbi:recombinase family protein, partial [Amycolatopsis sp. NPDC023774]|uniref:recombinase family protein n=1 Tax=Amycolatopsis sp. NPDC023774 TaxID=3155015 RepID=UPI003407D16E